MNKFILAIAVMTSAIIADTTKVSDESKFEISPVIKSELLFIQGIEKDASAGNLLLGEQDYGVSITKGKTNVTGAATFSGEVTNETETGIVVGLSEATITQEINDDVSLTFGYDIIPFGFWTSNSVNYPLARFGGWNGTTSSVRSKALQTTVNVNKGIVEANVAGYQGTSGNFSSIAAKVSVDLTMFAPEVSIKSDGLDSTTISLGLGVDLGKVLVNSAFFTGIDADEAGAYLEVGMFANDNILLALRGETLNDKAFTVGETQFSLSGLYLLNDNVYFGVEYNAWMTYDDMGSPVHTVTGLIGYEF